MIRLVTSWDLLVVNVASTAKLNRHNHHYLPFPIKLIIVMEVVIRP